MTGPSVNFVTSLINMKTWFYAAAMSVNKYKYLYIFPFPINKHHDGNIQLNDSRKCYCILQSSVF